MESENNELNLTSIRIKQMRLDKGWTQKDLAKMLGLKNDTAIANYEAGYSTPKDDIKSKMCELFDCSMDYLMGESNFRNVKDEFTNYLKEQDFLDITKAIEHNAEDFILAGLTSGDVDKFRGVLTFNREITPQENYKKINDYINTFENEQKNKVKKLITKILEELADNEKTRSTFYYYASRFSNEHYLNKNESSQYYMCPVYGQISAGQPNWAEECIEGRLPIDPELMGIVNPEEHFFLRVNGESMNKVIKNGAFALIHKQDIVENGEIAVVLVNGYDATLKRFSKQGDIIVLTPESTDENFKQQIYTKDTPIQIIGKYVGKMEINK